MKISDRILKLADNTARDIKASIRVAYLNGLNDGLEKAREIYTKPIKREKK